MLNQVTLEKIVAWAKRRGFVYQTSDIYGGVANNYDYGPYGTQLKKNIADLWWKTFVTQREEIIGLDGAILMQKEVWEASGHTDSFNEALVEDKVTHKRYRADHLIQAFAKKNNQEIKVESLNLEEMKEFIEKNDIKSPEGNELAGPKLFNQMFETHAGFDKNEEDLAYLRPETAQSIFINFKNVLNTVRMRIPFGIAQVGKAFRNEITKGQFIFRTIETEQMEIEYFIDPQADWEKLMNTWLEDMKNFYLNLGAREEDLRFRQHEEEELSHYSKRTYDPEYKFDFGWAEIAGLAHRVDFDLQAHSQKSGKSLTYKDPKTNREYIPHILEPSFGLARAVLVTMYAAYTEESLENGKSRVVLKFPKNIAPVQVAVFPLQKDEKLQSLARKIYNDLSQNFSCEYDDAGNIGKMYRRQDEIGTPWCITVDYSSLDDNTVTIRDRDTMEQQRISVPEIFNWVSNNLNK